MAAYVSDREMYILLTQTQEVKAPFVITITVLPTNKTQIFT